MAEERDKALREKGLQVLGTILQGYFKKTDTAGQGLITLTEQLSALTETLEWGKFSDIQDE